jgi:glycolate oxidase FAD binding subunit
MSDAETLEHEPALRTLIERVQQARAERHSLDLRGGGTKAFYGGAPRGEPLAMGGLRGISSYEPTELVVTVRAGTPLAELEALLAEQGQCLAFEPPRFAAGGSVGGMVAAGLSGPSRAALGAVRDHVLGATLLNGRAEVLSFGGQVMKNVAGYDVSRLLAGSMGVLGAICEVSLKVLPRPAATATLRFEMAQAEALQQLNLWRQAAAAARQRLVAGADGAAFPARRGGRCGGARARRRACRPSWPPPSGTGCATTPTSSSSRRAPRSNRAWRCGGCRCRPLRRH